MKAVYLVPLALLSPLAVLGAPIVLPQDMPSVATHENTHLPPPSTVVAPAQPSHPTPEVILDVEDAAVQVAFDNHPVTPSAASKPEEVLSLPQPVATAYLLSLNRPPASDEADRKKPAPAEAAPEAWETFEVSSIVEMEVGLVEHRNRVARHACYYARLTRERNDRLVVFLVVAFVLIVVVVETWEAAYASISRLLTGRGAIRLEERDQEQPLSIRAEETVQDEPTEHIQGEKATAAAATEAL